MILHLRVITPNWTRARNQSAAAGLVLLSDEYRAYGDRIRDKDANEAIEPRARKRAPPKHRETDRLNKGQEQDDDRDELDQDDRYAHER